MNIAGSLRASRVAVALALTAMPASADLAPDRPTDEASLAVTGEVENDLHLSIADLQRMPQAKVTVSYVTGHGKEEGTFSGPLLWDVLEKAALSDDGKKGSMLRRVIVVTGRDDYAVVLSAGEIASDFEHKTVILALAKDGKALGGDGIRLIVPGDTHGGRAVRDVVAIEVK